VLLLRTALLRFTPCEASNCRAPLNSSCSIFAVMSFRCAARTCVVKFLDMANKILEFRLAASWKPGWIGIIPKGSTPTETIPLMSYVEATQLKKVLHPSTCYPLMEKEIPLRVGNTLEFLHPGTLIANKTSRFEWPPVATSPSVGVQWASKAAMRAFSTARFGSIT